MGVKSKTYDTINGLYTLTIPELAFRKIVSVKREGLGHDIIISGTVGNRQVLYTASGGLFTFENAFTGYSPPVNPWDPAPIIVTEKVFIIWDE